MAENDTKTQEGTIYTWEEICFKEMFVVSVKDTLMILMFDGHFCVINVQRNLQMN